MNESLEVSKNKELKNTNNLSLDLSIDNYE